MSRTLPTVLCLIAAAALAGCGGSAIPTVEIVGASPSTLDPAIDAADDLTIEISYTDPDGDLGSGVAEVHDCRADGVVTRFDLPSIASKEAVDEGVEIAGKLTLLVADVGDITVGKKPPLCDSAQAFCVVLVDGAGNESEPACTKPIQIAAPKP